MKKRFLVFLALTLAAALPVSAQINFDLIGRATWIDSTGDSLDFSDEDDFGLDFDDEVGFGLAFNAFLTDRWSVEIGASLIEPDFLLVVEEPEGPRGTEGLEMVPVTAALQFHLFGPSRFDPYVGVGGTYLIFDDVNEVSDLTQSDVEAIEFEGEFGWMVNAGVNIGFFRSLALNVDVKYSEIEPEAEVTFLRGDFTSRRETELNPLLVSVGVAWRF